MKKSLFSAIVITLLLSSCSDNNSFEQLLDDSVARHLMTFSVSQEPLSRGVTLLENASDLNQFYVVAQVKDGLQEKIHANLSFYRNGTENKFNANSEVFWPDDSREEVTFYAINSEIGANDRNYLYEAIQQNQSIVPLSNHSIEISVDDSFNKDLVAAYSVTSANQTIDGVAPLVFNHILAEVEVYAKADNSPNMSYAITSITFESEDNTRIYHFDTNTWSTGDKDNKIREVSYFRSNGLAVIDTDNYKEVVEVGVSSGAEFRFMLPGDYNLRVGYIYDAAGASTTKTCSVTLQQNQKNRINLTLTPPVN